METSSISGLGASMGGMGSAAKANEMGRETFLTMLVAQLKNQDPLNPVKGTDFTAQLAQFSSLEQMMKVNKNIEGLQLIQTSQNNAMMTNMIGKQVEANGNSTSVKDGEASDITYKVNGNARNVDIFIRDSDGILVKRILHKDVEAGNHTFSWNGKNDNGSDLADGQYSYSITAKDGVGSEVEASTFSKGEITSVSFNEDGTTSIWMGSMQISLQDIIKIGSAGS